MTRNHRFSLTRLFSRRKNRKRAASRRPFRPLFETLEDRRLLATLTVNSPLDNLTPGDNLVTLREAIIAANTDTATDLGDTGSGADTITFDPSLDTTPIVLTIAGGSEDGAATGDLDVTSEITIQGNGVDVTTIDADGIDRVLHVLGSGNLTLADVTITGGLPGGRLAASGAGLAIESGGSAVVTSSTVTGNTTGGRGAGINNAGTLTVSDSTISGNEVTGVGSTGGGIRNDSGDATLTNSTVSGNIAGGFGGGVENYGGTLKVINSTISGNSADGGGGILNRGESGTPGVLTVVNSTITNNSRQAYAPAGIDNYAGSTATIHNSIVANNTFTDLRGTFSGTNNLVGDGSGTGLTGTINGDPMLGPLQDNGGPTLTHALLSGSPAIDAGSDDHATEDGTPVSSGGTALTIDQRGYGPRIEDGTVDIGAFEANAVPPVAIPDSFVVTTTVDENDGTTDPETGAGTSLREAIIAANADPNQTTITFDPALTAGGPATVDLSILGNTSEGSSAFEVTTPITIEGPAGANGITLARNMSAPDMRLFLVQNPTGDLVLRNLTLTGGKLSETGSRLGIGGAVLAFVRPLTIENSVLIGNSAAAFGGAIGSSSGEVNVINTTISDNTANRDGGGIWLSGGTVTLSDSTVSGNTADDGGGIFAYDGELRLINSTVSGNTAQTNGGGVYSGFYDEETGSSETTLVNSTISGNAASNGGGIMVGYGSVALTNTTVIGNTSGGGIVNNYAGSSTVLYNSLVAGNTGGDLINTAGSFSGANNLIQDSSELGSFTDSIDGDPLLGPLQDNGGATETHALQLGSPAIDTGNDRYATNIDDTPLTTDQRGTGFDRILGAAVDIGAFEVTPPDSFIVDIATDVVNGNMSPGDVSLREAILAANADPNQTTITFDPSLDNTPIVLTIAGTGEDAAADGDLDVTTEVIIQGNGADMTTIDANSIDRVLHVLSGGDLTLDGVTITGGVSQGASITNYGGGIHNTGTLAVNSSTVSLNSADRGSGISSNHGSLTINESTLSGNTGGRGGGLYLSYGTATIDGSTISDNSVSRYGGGIFIFGTEVTITNSTVTRNSADRDGGGISLFGSGGGELTQIESSTISDNSARDGGGLDNVTGTARITNSTISGNTASSDGGGIDNNSEGSELSIDGSTVSDNSATYGGGIFQRGGASLTLRESTISGNTADGGGGGLYNYQAGSTMSITGSMIAGNTAGTYGGGGISNYSDGATLRLTGTTVSGNTATAGNGGGIRNAYGTAELANTTISGNTAPVGGGIANYYSGGALTLVNITISNNTATSTGGGVFNDGTATVDNTIVANSSGADLAGSGNFAGSNNLIGDGSNAGTSLTGTINGDPLLGPLQDNGGPTETHALLTGSPAIDAGDNALLPADEQDLDGDTDTAEAIPFDQRGMGFDRIVGGSVDIGAFEFVPPPITVIVTKAADTDDGTCDADCSLREAVIAANANVSPLGPDTILFDAGLDGTPITLTLSGTDNTSALGDLDLSGDLVIQGNGARKTIIDAGGAGGLGDRVIHILPGADVTIDGVEIKGGDSNAQGAGIRNAGALTLVGSSVSGNDANTQGGGVFSNGTATIVSSLISGNTAGGRGGGLYGSDVTIANSTISGNTASGNGGGIYNDGNLTAANLTIALNSGASGGGIFNNGSMSLDNSIITLSTGGDCAGGGAASGSNNRSDDATCVGDLGAVTGFDSTLADNGGPTDTHALQSGSNAIDAGDNALVPADSQDLDGDMDTAEPLFFDQRGLGFARMVDGGGGATVDLGAFEFVPSTAQIADDDAPIFSGGGFSYLASMKNPHGFPGPDGILDQYYSAANSGNMATWTFTVTPGVYRVSANWTPHVNRATNSPFSVFDGPAVGLPVQTKAVNQELAPDDFTDGGAAWEDIFPNVTITGTTLTVKLSDTPANGFVIADGMRIERILGPEVGLRDVDGKKAVSGGDTVDLGFVVMGSTVTRDFRISNLASNDLDVSNVSVSPAGSAFSLNPDPNPLGAIGFDGSTDFTIELDTSAAGLQQATVTIASNDPTQPSFTFDVTATVGAKRIIDDGDAGFAGSKFTGFGAGFTGAPQGYQDDVHYHAPATPGFAAAKWIFGGLEPGTYQVSVTWNEHANRSNQSSFTISGTTSDGTVQVNQRQAPSSFAGAFTDEAADWAPLNVGGSGGNFTLSGSTLTVTLGTNAFGYVIADAVRIEKLSMLRAESAAAPGTDGSAAAAVRTADATALLDEAIAHWSSVDRAAAARLAGVSLQVADLPGDVLGLASAGQSRIWLDTDAAGHGWNMSRELRDESRESDDSDAHSGSRHSTLDSRLGIDLLSVVTHELGHVLGLPDLDHIEYPTNIMAGRLAAGTRRLPDLAPNERIDPIAAQRDWLFADFGRDEYSLESDVADRQVRDESQPSVARRSSSTSRLTAQRMDDDADSLNIETRSSEQTEEDVLDAMFAALTEELDI